MKAIHYYILNQDQQLRSEIATISALLLELEQQKAHQNYVEIKKNLESFYFRKQIELLNFNKQVAKKRFKFNVEKEHQRIKNDLEALNKLQSQINLNSLKPLTDSLHTHQEHFVVHSAFKKILKAVNKKISMLGETWEGARALVAVGSQILNFVGAAISGIFDVITLTGETIANLAMRKRALKKYAVGRELYLHNKNTDSSQSPLSPEAQAYEQKTSKTSELINQKSDIHLLRSVTGMINGTIGIIGSIISLATIGIGVVSLLQFYNVIALSLTLISTLSIATTYLSIFGPLALAGIFANKLQLTIEEQSFKEKSVLAAKVDFTKELELLNINDKKLGYVEWKNNYLTCSNYQAEPDQDQYLKIYEKELRYRKEKTALQSIGVTKVFTGISLGASTLAVAGATLLCLTVLGVLSGGVLPASLLIAGSVIAIGSAVFEYVDKNNNRKYTNLIRDKWKTLKGYFTNQENKKEDKVTQNLGLKKTLHNSASNVLAQSEPNFSQYDEIYSQLHAHERKSFRKAAWERVRITADTLQSQPNNSTPAALKVSYLNEAKKWKVFNEPRHTFGFFKNTTTVNEIDAAIHACKLSVINS